MFNKHLLNNKPLIKKIKINIQNYIPLLKQLFQEKLQYLINIS